MSEPLERVGLVDRLSAALLAADQVLRLVGGSSDGSPGLGGVGGDLLEHLTLRMAAVAAPADLVALLELRHSGVSSRAGLRVATPRPGLGVTRTRYPRGPGRNAAPGRRLAESVRSRAMATDTAAWAEVLATMIGHSHLTPAEQLNSAVNDAVRPVGLDAQVMMVDLSQRLLHPLVGGEPQPVETSLAGRAYQTTEV